MSMNSSSLFDNGTVLWNNSQSVRWPGGVMVTYSLAAMGAYILCLVTIISNKETARTPSYQIILHIGLSDLGQLLLNGIVGGIFSLCQSDFNFYLNKIIGGIMNSVWVVYITMAHLLAWNRLIHTCNPAMAKRIFTLKNTRIILGICWMYGLAWIVAFMCPNLDLLYDPVEHNWSYGPHPSAQMLSIIELSQDIFHCMGMAACYTAIISKIVRQARQITNHQLNSDKKEKIVLIQSLWLCMVSCAAVSMFFFNTAIIPDHWAKFFATTVWLGMAGSNAFIYLIFNKSIRRQLRQWMPCRKTAVVPVDRTFARGSRQATVRS